MKANSKIDKIKLLNDSFPGMTEDELIELANLTHIHTYTPGVYLCREGKYEDVFYILAEGEADITMKIGDQGEERLLRVAHAGDYFGEMGLIQNTTRAASIRTKTNATTLEMRKSDFEAALRISPRMAFNIMHAIIDRLRSNDQVVIKELRVVNETLKMLDRNKMEFIEIAAHELRTPITVMTGYTRMIQVDPAIQDSPMLQEVAKGIIKGTERLLEVVNAMLDVTRLANKNIVIMPSPVILRSVIKQLVRTLTPDIQARKLKVIQEHDKNLSHINADPPMIEKAVGHLIRNAIKYTPDGREIYIYTRSITMPDGTPGAEMRVEDKGIGIDPAQQKLIFEKFYQVGSAALHSSGQTSFKGGGPGVGLAIAKGVAESHGGKLWVESEGYDEENYPGSTFFMQVPIDPPKNTETGSNSNNLS